MVRIPRDRILAQIKQYPLFNSSLLEVENNE